MEVASIDAPTTRVVANQPKGMDVMEVGERYRQPPSRPVSRPRDRAPNRVGDYPGPRTSPWGAVHTIPLVIG